LSEIAKNKIVIPLELIHSKIVYDVKTKNQTQNKTGDGIITANPKYVPIITVADCVPIYFYDCKSQVFGVVHSGWKGTGIIEEALKIAVKKYSCAIEDICVAIGPHIHDCCYVVNEERAAYFVDNFSKECVKKIDIDFFAKKELLKNWNYGSGNLYSLSLLQANLSVLAKIGINPQNIVVAKNCTCCNEIFGSNRRETLSSDNFTVQAAFLGYF
jgi:YfiH family protein